jgi:hypothetical protein
MRRAVPLLLLAGCAEAPVGPKAATHAPAASVSIEDFRQVVPGDGLPPEVQPQNSNNNLDVAWHDGRLYLAFRTAPTHFASDETEVYIVSSTDEQTWRFEGHIAMGTDLREPNLVSWNGTLTLYLAVLGTDPLAFEPQGTIYTQLVEPGTWTEPVWHDLDTLIAWRIKEMDGKLYLIGYTGGEGIYDPESDPIEIHWLTSDNAIDWVPASGGDPVVLTGGGSESDMVFLDDGDVLVVVRNEAGDEDGYGSKICRGPADNPSAWACAADPKKYDSPLLFLEGGTPWLVGRRNVTEDGAYDLGMDDLSPLDQYWNYQAEYWNNPKRCGLWQVDPDALTVAHVVDLPSKGDTCFPELVEGPAGGHVLYNYSSDPDLEPDPAWFEGQLGPTQIYRQELVFGR